MKENLSTWLKKILFIYLIGVTMTACGEISVVNEVTFDFGQSTEAIAIEKAHDNGFFVALQTISATILRIDSVGNILWRFDEGNSIFKMITPTADGGVIACGQKSGLIADKRARFGFVVRLDSSGKEMQRLDPSKIGYGSNKISDVLTCAKWGDGFVLSALTPPDENSSSAMSDPYKDSKTSVFRLGSDFSIIWDRKLPVGAVGIPTAPRPRPLANDDLVIPSSQGVYLLDVNGNLKKNIPLENCEWVRIAPDGSNLDLVCLGGEMTSPATVLNIDSKLNILKRTELQGMFSGPIVAEGNDGGYAAITNGSNSHGPRIWLFSATGKAVGDYIFPTGNSREVAVAEPSGGIAFLRNDERHGHLVATISWLKF